MQGDLQGEAGGGRGLTDRPARSSGVWALGGVIIEAVVWRKIWEDVRKYYSPKVSNISDDIIDGTKRSNGIHRNYV